MTELHSPGVCTQIETLAAGEIARLLIRHRRGGTLERFQPQIDAFLRDVLHKANEFVPSQAGAILLDDPKSKLFEPSRASLTVIAALAERPGSLLGCSLSCTDGLVGQVYRGGRAMRWATGQGDGEAYRELQDKGGVEVRSLLGVPVVLGNAVCGEILLINRLGFDYFSDENCTLLEIFAAYISSSIQNTLDGMRAKDLAQRDDLTGLYNDRYLHFKLRSEIEHAAKNSSDLCLIFFDLDHFKSINDRFGHLEGSHTLHLIGILLQNEIPSGAIAARYGGDEFVVILPGMDAAQGREVAMTLREKIAGTRFVAECPGGSDDGDLIEITASLGVASLGSVGEEPGESDRRANLLIRRADEAMYQAKAQGRDRVVIAMSQYEE